MTSPVRAWAVLTAIGLLTVLGVQWVFRERDPFWVLPVAQAVGLFVAWTVAWPLWFRQQPNRRFGFLGHSVSILVIAVLIAAVRIALRIG